MITDECIETLESGMLQFPQAVCNVRHIFGPGLYIRELTIPADTYAIGHYQKTVHMNVMVKGRVTVINNDGSKTELIAPVTFIGQPGRKIGYVHEEMVWLNVYATTETDVDKLEAMFLDKSGTFVAHQNRIAHQCNGKYLLMLDELGVSESLVRQQSEDESDQVPFPMGSYKVKIGSSLIEGRGLIATADIEHDEVICPVKIDGKRTPAGRYTNHADEPNAKVMEFGTDLFLVSLRPIKGCRGGNDGEEITVDYRQSVKANLENGAICTCQA